MQNAPLGAELEEAFRRVLKSGQYILGQEVERLEAAVASQAGVQFAIGVSSGTDAILLALMALGIGPGDEVICPSFTFFATAGCVARVGATPVFCDSNAQDFNLDVEDAARRISPRTKAIIPVHLFGQMAEMDAVMELASRHNLAVIEDAAQSLGSLHRGHAAGSIGTFGTFSFYPSKNLGAIGDAGMLVTNSEPLAATARMLRVHGAESKYFHKLIGGNFRIDSLQAALLMVKLPHLAGYSRHRAEHAARYNAELAGMESSILLPSAHPYNHHIWNQYTVRITNGRRNALKNHLAANGIGSEIYYPRPMHLQECFARPGLTPDPLPVCEKLAEECLSIPIAAEMTRSQQDEVISSIKGFVFSSGA